RDAMDDPSQGKKETGRLSLSIHQGVFTIHDQSMPRISPLPNAAEIFYFTLDFLLKARNEPAEPSIPNTVHGNTQSFVWGCHAPASTIQAIKRNTPHIVGHMMRCSLSSNLLKGKNYGFKLLSVTQAG
ncbi:MAG: hypothetical protein AAGU02_07355, partial [Lawsonibacter sp.]